MHSIIQEDLEFIVSTKLPWQALEGKNVLITGANGFLSAYMIETILYLNHRHFKKKARIFALARDKKRVSQRFDEYKDRKDLSFIIQDVCTPVTMKEKIDYIIHAASQASPKYYVKDPVGTLSANVLGTAHLLDLAKKHKVKGFLFFSSGEVYGKLASGQIPTKEEHCGCIELNNFRTCYGQSKRMGETMCASWLHQYGVPVTIVRPFHTYGPKMKLDDGRVFADFVADIVAGRSIQLKSSGRARRAFCYLADAVAGFFTVLLAGQKGQAYNVGNESCEISVRDLAQMLVGLFPEKRLKVITGSQAPNDAYLQRCLDRVCPDTAKIRALGWKPRYGLQEGFTRTIRSFI